MPHSSDWPINSMDQVYIDYFEHKDNHFVIGIDYYSELVDVGIAILFNIAILQIQKNTFKKAFLGIVNQSS